MWLGVMTVLLSPLYIVAWMVANSVGAYMLSEMWTSLEDGCVGHRLKRVSTFVPLAWTMLNGEGISETFLLHQQPITVQEMDLTTCV